MAEDMMVTVYLPLSMPWSHVAWTTTHYSRTKPKPNVSLRTFLGTSLLRAWMSRSRNSTDISRRSVDHDALFQDKTQAQRLATDIFGNQFTACLDVTFKELDGHFKTYTDLTAAQGQIQSRPGVRKNMKAFVQWTRDPRCSCR
jgi:hypothetical protein